MSLLDRMLLIGLFSFSYVLVFTHCKVVLVNRSKIDSFRVGEDGCTNDSNCTEHSTCQQSGLCLCNVSLPNFRNPVIRSNNSELTYGDTYGCVENIYVRKDNAKLQKDVDPVCKFEPFQLIPNNDSTQATEFLYDDKNVSNVLSCNFSKAWAKFPDNVKEIEQQWLSESYIDIKTSEKMLHFKWKKKVPQLQGTIITLVLICQVNFSGQSYESVCLQAKVLGTWREGANVPVSASISVPVPVSNTSTPKYTVASLANLPTSTSSAGSKVLTGSSSNDDDDGMSLTILVIAVVVPVVLLIVLSIAVCLLCRRKKGKKAASAVPSSMRSFNRNDSNLRGPEAYTDDPLVDTTGTFGRPRKPSVENAYSNLGYSTPDIKRAEVNGDIYTVPYKGKNRKKDDYGLSYTDPSVLVSGNNQEMEDIYTQPANGQISLELRKQNQRSKLVRVNRS